MAANPGPVDQAITDGRLTLKRPYLDFLDNPPVVDITYGPGNSFLIHNPAWREEFVNKVLPPKGMPLNQDEDFVDRRLNSGRREAPVDEQGRIRIEQVYLGWAGLMAKSQAYLMPRDHHRWIEVSNEEGYYNSLRSSDDRWQEALNNVVEKLRRDQ